MPKIRYVEHEFGAAARDVISKANTICAAYAAQGFDLTLRQLYYQFVSRGLIANKDSEYKRLGSIINDARLAGLLDWNYIVDRTRNLRALSHWGTPGSIIQSAADSYAVDRWGEQWYRPEVWIEKDALVGVIEGVCQRFDVPFFSCRGYTSQSEVWAAAQRLRGYAIRGQKPIILHLGDHDPSGKDMTRDITDRLRLFMGGVPVERLALNYDQVQQYRPPPNPAKLTDARAAGYIAEFGPESWELDALEPSVIAGLIEGALDGLIEAAAWEETEARQEEERRVLTVAAERWDEVVALLEDG